MKAHVADYATRVYCVRIVPAGDAPAVRLAGYPVDLPMSNGQVYAAENGYEFSGVGASSTFASSSVDLKGILAQGFVSQNQLASGVYDNARVYLFATSWAAPIEDEEPIALFFWGRVEHDELNDQYTTQLMGAIDVLSQSSGRTYSPGCQWTLFDEHLGGEELPYQISRCSGPRGAPDGPRLVDHKVTGALTAVSSQYVFRDSSRAEAADWFAYGAIRFTTGSNAGLKALEIKSYAADGTITLHEALFYAPQIGDQYEMIPGCRKRFAEDCKTKWANGRNYGGHPHVPVQSVANQRGRGA